MNMMCACVDSFVFDLYCYIQRKSLNISQNCTVLLFEKESSDIFMCTAYLEDKGNIFPSYSATYRSLPLLFSSHLLPTHYIPSIL